MAAMTERMEAFSRVAAKREGSSGFDFIEAILRERPDLVGKMTYTPEQGAEGHTVFIGDEVFKGPVSSTIGRFYREIDILKQLEGKGLPIPRVTCEGEETIFYGMTCMPGILLGKDFNVRLSPDELRRLAKDIVDFVINMANALPQREGAFVMHNDLYYDNILIDPKTKRLSGIIDFGRVNYCKKNNWTPHCVFRGDFRKMICAEFELRKSEIPDYLPPRKTVSLQAQSLRA